MADESLYKRNLGTDSAEKKTHTVAKGDTLNKIASSYGVTPQQIAETNGIKDPNRIKVGATYIIPTTSTAQSTPIEYAGTETPAVDEIQKPATPDASTDTQTDTPANADTPAVPTDAKTPAADTQTTPATVAPQVNQSTLAELYERFYPKPKELEITEEEKAKLKRQNEASAVILGIADAINGFSNLYATTQGAPSREITPASAKWGDAVAAMKRTQEEKINKYREGFYRANIDDFKLNEERRRLAEQRQMQLDDKNAANEEWQRRFEAQSSAAFANWLRERGITKQDEVEKARREYDYWMKKENVSHSNKLEIVDKQNQGRIGAVNARESAKASAKAKPFIGTLKNGDSYNYSWGEKYDSQNYFELYRLMVNAVKTDNENTRKKRKYPSDISTKFGDFSEMPTLNKAKVLVDTYFPVFAEDIKNDFDAYLVGTGQYSNNSDNDSSVGDDADLEDLFID